MESDKSRICIPNHGVTMFLVIHESYYSENRSMNPLVKYIFTADELYDSVKAFHNASSKLPEAERPKIIIYDLSQIPQVTDIDCQIKITTDADNE